MKILVGYATNSSGTQTVAGNISSLLIEKGHKAKSTNIREVEDDEIQNSDLVILGSPSWDYNGVEGQPHENMSAFFAKYKGRLFPKRPFAVFGLGDKAYMQFCGAVDYMEKFVKNADGKLIIDSLKIDGFYFDQSKNERIIEDWVATLITKLK